MEQVMKFDKVGFIGFGVVNQAVYGNLKTRYQKSAVIFSQEPKFYSNQEQLLKTDCIILCIPTDFKDSQEESLNGIMTNLLYLFNNNYSGIIAIKSTCSPKVLKDLLLTKLNIPDVLNLIFWPEFLNARSANEDFKKESYQLFGGDVIDCLQFENIFRLVFNKPDTPEKKFNIVHTTAQAAMDFKFFRNAYIYNKIMFFNAAAKTFDTDIRLLSKNLEQVPCTDNITIGGDGKLGAGGACLPKDLNNLLQLCECSDDVFNYWTALKDFNNIRN